MAGLFDPLFGRSGDGYGRTLAKGNAAGVIFSLKFALYIKTVIYLSLKIIEDER